jgi:hypothetical protein
MLLLATSISVSILNNRAQWKKVRRNYSRVAPGLKVSSEVHTFVVDDHDHPQMIEIHAQNCRAIHDAHTCLVEDSFWMMWKKKKTC